MSVESGRSLCTLFERKLNRPIFLTNLGGPGSAYCPSGVIYLTADMICGNSNMPARTKQGVLTKMKMVAKLESPSSDTGKGRSKLSSRLVYGFSLVKGKANHPMEDYHVAEFRRISNHELGLFAIFDGHMGHEVAQYLQEHLFDNILRQPKCLEQLNSATLKAYEDTDRTILQKVSELGLGGSTAVTAILVNGRKLLVANVGDSRAVLCRSGDAIQLSVEHEPKGERRSIERRGGFVTVFPGDVPRVDGQLAVARAFGDKKLKAHLSSEPDVIMLKIEKADEFLILASDGLWKVMENQEAVDLARRVRDPDAAAKVLTAAALSRKSRDDISCVVIRLQ